MPNCLAFVLPTRVMQIRRLYEITEHRVHDSLEEHFFTPLYRMFCLPTGRGKEKKKKKKEGKWKNAGEFDRNRDEHAYRIQSTEYIDPGGILKLNRVWCRVSFLFFLFFFVKTHRTNEGLAINELPPRSGKIRGWNWTLCRRKREANAVVTVNSFSRRVKSRSPRFPARTARDTRETRVYFTRKEKERGNERKIAEQV